MPSPWLKYQASGPWQKYAAGPSMGETLTDVAQSAGSGLVRGAAGLAGLPGDMLDIVGSGVKAIGSKLGLPEPPPVENPSFLHSLVTATEPPTSQSVTSAIENNIGQLHEPQTTAGKYAQSVGEFAPAALAGPGGIARRAITQAVLPGVASEAAGEATQGTVAEPYARALGGILGGVSPMLPSRMISPLPITPERQAAVNLLRREGVQPSVGQATGRRSLRYFENEMGGGTIQAADEARGEAFTAAALRRAGITANRATPDVLDHAFTRIGGRFDNLAARTSVPLDPQFQNDLLNVVTDYQAVAGAPAQAVEQAMNRIADVAAQNGGVLQGEAYQNIRSKLGQWIKAADGPTKMALRDIQNVMDDAVERHMSQADLADWRDARRQYRNMIVIENASTGAGEDAAMGIISPAKLRQAAVSQDKRGYVRGRSDFSELAHAGQAVLTPLPQSGTAPRLRAMGVTHGISSLAGGLAGGSFAGGPGAMAGMVAGAAIPPALGRFVASRAGQRYLTNQLVGPLGSGAENARRAALIAILMGPQQMQTGQ